MARRSRIEVARERAELLRLQLESAMLRARLDHVRGYDAAASTQYRPRKGDSRSANAVMHTAGASLRQWARHLDENHDLAVGILDDLSKKIVGCGIAVEPMVNLVGGDPAAAANRTLRDLWADWTTSMPDTTRSMPWPQIESLVCRQWLRDGELLVHHVTGLVPGLRHRSRVPYSIELAEADYLPFTLMRASSPTQHRIVHGVEMNDWREPVAYHLYREHPGDASYASSSVVSLLETKRVSADDITHLKFVRRLGQVRGVPIFHAVLQRLEDLKDYEESERVAARVAAAFTAVITKSTDFQGASNLSDSGNRNMEMNPGMIFDDLLPGEDVRTIGANRPSEQLAPFRESMLRAIASGTGASYSGASRNYNGTYSAQRQELVESWVGYEMAREYLIAVFYRGVWRRFVDMAVAAGLMRLSGLDLSTLYRADWLGPSMPWIDPVKEVEAAGKAVEYGFKSRHMVIRENQYDPMLVDEQIEADTFSQPAQQEPSVPQPVPDDGGEPIEDAA